jgi:hypothetical protein
MEPLTFSLSSLSLKDEFEIALDPTIDSAHPLLLCSESFLKSNHLHAYQIVKVGRGRASSIALVKATQNSSLSSCTLLGNSVLLRQLEIHDRGTVQVRPSDGDHLPYRRSKISCLIDFVKDRDVLSLLNSYNSRQPLPQESQHQQIGAREFSEIGGYDDVKAAVIEMANTILSARGSLINMSSPKGILLYGPPGCSKTMIARSLARAIEFSFFSIKGPEIFSKWVGDSEKQIKEIFDKARAQSPSLIFIDEIDAIARKRTSLSFSVESRVLGQLLTEMDGINSHSDRLLIVAATNRPDIIDRSLMRPGRLDRHILVPLPNVSSIDSIIDVASRRFGIHDPVALKSNSELFLGMSGAEIISLFEQAAFEALRSNSVLDSLSILTRLRPIVD